MMKKLLAVAVGMMVVGGVIADVEYLDAEGRVQTCPEVEVVTDMTEELKDGCWYAVEGRVSRTSFTVRGSAHLILLDDCHLNVEEGIFVPRASSITIYGQCGGTGELNAKGAAGNAGIGGRYGDGSQTDDFDCGSVTINAGIGGYSGGQDSLDVDRGQQDCGTVTINGGTVVAQGGFKAAGIGGSDGADGGTVTIRGGTVEATGGRLGAGIGNAYNRHHCNVTITGGKVTARKGSGGGADDIGCGGCAGTRQPGVTVEISGGVFANALKNEWCPAHYVPVDNTDPETCADYPYTVQRQCIVTVGKRPPRVAIAWTGGDGSVTNEVAGESFDVPPGTANVRVIVTSAFGLLLDGETEIDLGVVTGDITFGDGNDYRIPRPYSPFGDIVYLDWNGSKMVTAMLSKYDYLLVTEATRELEDGVWYVVTNDVVLPKEAYLRAKGDARLLLCDGASLTVTNGLESCAAVEVAKSLTICGQAGNTGTLTAQGRPGGAGIGGSARGSGGIVTINGGMVTATGGEYGAGIGGGEGGYGGTVTINGGAVTAHGGYGAEDIGCGEGTESGTVQVSGGIFWAKPKDGWLVAARSAVPNMDPVTADAYPWRVVESKIVVRPGSPMGPFLTAEEATNAWVSVEFVPSEEVAGVLTTGLARRRYAGWFDFDITSKAVNEWYVEAVLSDAAKTRLTETATAATRQIPVAEIAAMAEGTKDVPVEGCEPGFYYTLHGGQGLTAPRLAAPSGCFAGDTYRKRGRRTGRNLAMQRGRSCSGRLRSRPTRRASSPSA